VRAGWVARRAIAAGEPLRPPAVAPPDAVRHGQPVRVVYRESGLAITISGTAAADAPVGARVAVRVESGGRARRLEGTVVAPGLVQLD
jgi:flagella basal body P-ring formation protein FlgA